MNSNFHTDIVFVDANALYDILALEGLDIPEIGACKNTNIKIGHFKFVLFNLLSKRFYMKKRLLILGITAFGINLTGNIILAAKLSQVKEYQESTFVVTFNEYDRSTHTIGALPSAIENTIKDISLKYVTEYTLAVINTVYKEGEISYKESAEQVTYYNTNIEDIKKIVTEVQSAYFWMHISF